MCSPFPSPLEIDGSFEENPIGNPQARITHIYARPIDAFAKTKQFLPLH